MLSGPSPKRDNRTSTILGYATNSWKSAFVMRMIDGLPAFRKRNPVLSSQTGMVISSITGLGDLVIQLPLIAGLVNQARLTGVEPLVALRPAHAPIGENCGWQVLPLEVPLQNLYIKTFSLGMIPQVFADIKKLRDREIPLWIDLTGNAVNALALRLGSVRSISAKATRGGKTMIDRILPHEPGENEYAYRGKLALFFGCELDHSIYQRLGEQKSSGQTIMALTTGSRWKSWPIAYFKTIAETFPSKKFLLTGSLREIPPDEMGDWEKLAALPNVSNRLDKMNVLELIRAVAGAEAFVGNDSGTAHIANAFRVPGAVIFGPTISETWSGNGRLRLFHDQSCPLYPCVQWTCKNQKNWCMKKTAPHDVVSHFENIFGRSKPVVI